MIPIPYEDFRSGLTFPQVREELAQEQRSRKSAGDYMYVTRKTVLGRMREYKLSAYEYYLKRVIPIVILLLGLTACNPFHLKLSPDGDSVVDRAKAACAKEGGEWTKFGCEL